MAGISDILGPATTVTFDCYGTLIDWRAGLNAGLRRLFGAGEGAAGDIHGAYVRHEATVESGPFRPYREILIESARRVASEAEIDVPAHRLANWPNSVAEWPPFPDTVAALIELKKRFRLGVLSNVDRDIFAGTAAGLGVAFDFVVTAEDVRAYKPAHAHFDRMLARHTEKDRVIHVAQSLYHDGVPASALGIAFVWINRYNDANTTGVTPVATYADLASFADAATAVK